MPIEQTEINVVREYLQGEFPDFYVADDDDFERSSRRFRASNGSMCYTVKFELMFWEETSNIKKALQDLELSRFMQRNKGKEVLVTTGGLKVL